MGLCSDLNNISSDSIPLHLLALVANFISHLQSFLFCFIKSMGFSRFYMDESEERLLCAGSCSGLTHLIALTEQLNVNSVFSYKEEEDGVESDCVVCLCRLADGDQVRRLESCSHVFHRECLDGWLFQHHTLNCPICRSPLVSEERLFETDLRLASDLVSLFRPTRW
ncbi:E3 ubiquitin-protein ligase RHA2A-like [Tasmannia lanceolata]|uniref:E3 ubiquitin-protein ligase RHA2A-like n=1 Tax=Tasmannia lanceolata TaxID=3420 RepID=UPI0040641231